MVHITPRLGIERLDTVVHQLVRQGVSENTHKAYATGKKRYLAFCTQLHRPPLPLQEDCICQFLHYFSYQAIRCYLSALRHLQIMSGLPDPSLNSFPRLDYDLKGVRREGPACVQGRCLPDIFSRIHKTWSRRQTTFDDIMLWAAFCLGFFDFMRAGEFTCPSRQAFLPHMLTPADISVDSHSSPTIMAVHLRQSKTDQFGAGMTLYLGRTYRRQAVPSSGRAGILSYSTIISWSSFYLCRRVDPIYHG